MLQRDTAIELIMLMKRMCEYYNEMYRTNEIFWCFAQRTNYRRTGAAIEAKVKKDGCFKHFI